MLLKMALTVAGTIILVGILSRFGPR
jgi:hypothetical protein